MHTLPGYSALDRTRMDSTEFGYKLPYHVRQVGNLVKLESFYTS